MRSGESKSERPEHCTQKGPKWGSKEGWGRGNEMPVQMSSDCLETSDTLFLRLTFGAAISPLPCSPLFALMPLVLACARLNTNVCKFWWKLSFSRNKFFLKKASFKREMHIDDSRHRLYHQSSPSSLRVPFKLFFPPFTRCWILCEPTCARRCSGSGGSPMWTVSTCTTFLTASSTGCSGVTARAYGAASPTAGSKVTLRSNPSRRVFIAKKRRL